MSNTLYITVGKFRQLNLSEPTDVTVIATDSYGTDVMTFDDLIHLKTLYPTQEDLIVAVLQLPAFEGGAIVHNDGTYELDAIGSVIVEGYPR